MARNEEKQLARLNRWYLQKQRDDENKKRPPRPKLESLTTPEDIKKWLPTITRDIDFYIKQMEVPCYRDQQIVEFNRRIGHLKGEYKAFLRKLRDLAPEDKITPWTDRPYTGKRLKVSTNCDNSDLQEVQKDSKTDANNANTDLIKESSPAKFIPLQTPVLDNDEHILQNFIYENENVSDSPDLSDETMNKPLQFTSSSSNQFVMPRNMNNHGKTAGILQRYISQKVEQRTGEAQSTQHILMNERLHSPLTSRIETMMSLTLSTNNGKCKKDASVSRNQRTIDKRQLTDQSTEVQSKQHFSGSSETGVSSNSYELSDVLNLPYSDSSSSDDET